MKDSRLLCKLIDTAYGIAELLPKNDLVCELLIMLGNATTVAESVDTQFEIIDEIKDEMLAECDDINKQILQLKSKF